MDRRSSWLGRKYRPRQGIPQFEQSATIGVAGFASAYDELKGDIHAALGNTAEARSAYERAIAAMDAALDQSIIKMKLDDLGETEVTL